MYDNKNITGACGVWSVDETITPKGFCNTPRELQNYSLANISTCIFMLNMLPYQMQEE